MSEPPFDPDQTIDERQLAPATRPARDAAPRDPRPAPADAPPPDDPGSDTIDEWRPRRAAARPAPAGGATVAEKRPVAVQPCPHCQALIDARLVLCPLCRKPTGKRAVPEGAVAIIAAVVVVLVVLYFVWDCVSGG